MQCLENIASGLNMFYTGNSLHSQSYQPIKSYICVRVRVRVNISPVRYAQDPANRQ